MNDDLSLLASAYLDGDVTQDERAAVEADAGLLAEVERLRAVRMMVGDVEPAAISMREAQLAAALDAWDRLPEAERTGSRRDVTPSGIDAAAVAGAAAVSAPTSLRDRRRTRSSRWLVPAAAALVLVLAGGVALQFASNRDDTTTTQDAATAERAEVAEPAAGSPEAAGGDTPRETDAPVDAVTEGSQLDTGISDVAPPGEDAGLDQLRTPADLADFAAAALDAPVAPDVPAATSAPADEDLSPAESALAATECPVCLGVDVIVGPAVYGDVPVVVGIDEGRNLAIAYRAATCAEVARARLP